MKLRFEGQSNNQNEAGPVDKLRLDDSVSCQDLSPRSQLFKND